MGAEAVVVNTHVDDLILAIAAGSNVVVVVVLVLDIDALHVVGGFDIIIFAVCLTH